jgi:tRNA threonylcarbamoyl adenosine modification protein (Sua5/YciO/YrdC/YwlC family)
MTRRFDTSDPDQRATGLREAASAVKRGDLVVLPTDTLYGLGADAFTNWAVQALLEAKGRGRATPTPVLVPSPSTLHGLVTAMPAVGWELVDAFWPGGLTLIAMQQPTLSWDLGDSRGTVAVRMPLHPVAIELLTATGPMAVSSANKSGMAQPTSAQEALDQLGDAVSVYLDAGPVPADGAASSIVDITGPEPVLLREGAIPFEKLAEVAGSLRRAR